MKNKKYITKHVSLFAVSLLATATIFSAHAASTTTTLNNYPPLKAVDPSLGTSTIPGISSSSSMISSLTRKETRKLEIKKITSKLETVPEDKKILHSSSQLGGAMLLLINQLSAASDRTELLIGKVESLSSKKESEGIDITLSKIKLEESKMHLNAANTSISALSELTENLMKETSTSTYKKAAQMKKVEFKNGIESARKNIKDANESLRQSIFTLKPKSDISTTTTVVEGAIPIQNAPLVTPLALPTN